ncbi:hypothetical protein B0H19DRAFT_1276972 [Mycena capillaripes]|nr:hypothetical protein B0H19DRAFT_1276972 [Mycena capillaripes]
MSCADGVPSLLAVASRLLRLRYVLCPAPMVSHLFWSWRLVSCAHDVRFKSTLAFLLLCRWRSRRFDTFLSPLAMAYRLLRPRRPHQIDAGVPSPAPMASHQFDADVSFDRNVPSPVPMTSASN